MSRLIVRFLRARYKGQDPGYPLPWLRHATIGRRYPHQASDTIKTPRHTPLWHFDTPEDFWAHIPSDCRPIAVEIHKRSKALPIFVHPERAVYILGPEDGSLPDLFTERAHAVVQIPGAYCYNLAVAGSIVLYDRMAKQQREAA